MRTVVRNINSTLERERVLRNKNKRIVKISWLCDIVPVLSHSELFFQICSMEVFPHSEGFTMLYWVSLLSYHLILCRLT